jgi:hypothetical protein
MKTLKINVPDGYEIDKEQSTFENIVFKEIEKELPKSWEELEKLDGYYVSTHAESIKLTCPSITRDDNRNIFVTKEQAEASVALAQLSQLREVYRQGWAPDWGDGTIKKFCIIPLEKELKIDIRWRTCYFFLSFQSEEIAKQFLENFKDLIDKAKPLMS